MGKDSFSKGFDAFDDFLSDYLKNAENVIDALEAAAEELTKDINRLPKPRSQINKVGYTHLLDSVTYKVVDSSVQVGWGKYYGPIIESGRSGVQANPHLRSTYNSNKEKYLKIMMSKIGQ